MNTIIKNKKEKSNTMKSFAKKLLVFCTLIYFLKSNAQAPNQMSYQAVIRNASSALAVNQAVGMKISILQGTATGTEVYKELFNPNPMTNANGLVTLAIGTGIPLTGTFAGIDWSTGPYFVKIETDPTGGTNYTLVSTSQLMSVPYALYAKSAGESESQGVGVTGIYMSTAQSIPSGTFTTLTNWNNLTEDGGNNYNNATGEYTITKAGVYLINAIAVLTKGNYEIPSVAITVADGSNVVGAVNHSSPINAVRAETGTLSIAKRYAVGAKLKIQVYQDSGFPLTVSHNNIATHFSIQYLHK